MGVALAVTITAICVTGFGCFALNGDPFTLRFTAWGVAHTRTTLLNNSTEKVGQVSFIGLRRFVVKTCSGARNRDWHDWDGCDEDAIWWADAECANGESSFYGFPCSAMTTCQEAAINNQVGAYMTCITLVFAIIGCLTRSKSVSRFMKLTQEKPTPFLSSLPHPVYVHGFLLPRWQIAG